VSSSLFALSEEFANAIERAGRSVVSVNEGGRSGVSGTIWREGLVVTAAHTIRGQQELTLELPGSGSTKASVVGRDPATDVALLRMKDSGNATAEFADAAKLRVGHFVLAVGRRPQQGLAASHGMIGGLGGTWRMRGGGRIDRWLRLDLTPFSGFSGGPLVTADGKIIGINTSGAQRSIVTITGETVNRVVDQLLAKGKIPQGYLGVGLQPVSLPKATASGAGGGLLVVMLEPGASAEKAGLMIGDIVIGFEDRPLTDLADLRTVLDPEQVGKQVHLRVLRGGQTQDVSLTVAERPE
jgi:S1-C subfamily serine protease